MERIKKIIEEKYWWRADYLLVMRWAELAHEEGSTDLEVMDYVIHNLFAKA